jgi:hypothetical protein
MTQDVVFTQETQEVQPQATLDVGAQESVEQKSVEQKQPRVTKISQSKSIFAAKLLMRDAGAYNSNKAFRADVINSLVSDLGVNPATASTMYNTLKNEAMEATPGLVIARDPKKQKAPSTGKRGRPLGSKNKPKAVAELPKTAEQQELVSQSIEQVTS